MKCNLGFLIYTYNRVDDARINMEIIKDAWVKSKLFSDIKIIHAYNGKKAWYPKKYIEDDLVVIKNSWHFQGAADLIDTGVTRFYKKYKNIDYLIVLAADTWLIKPKYVYNIIQKMQQEKLHLATCAWGLPQRNDIADVGMAVDFCIIDAKWAKKYKMFPVNYQKFYKKYADLFLYIRAGNLMLEKLLYAKYLQAINKQEKTNFVARKFALNKMYILKDREPVHNRVAKDGLWSRKMYWPKMGLLTHHDPKEKKFILKKLAIICKGVSFNKLITQKDLSYYNKGVARMQYNKN